MATFTTPIETAEIKLIADLIGEDLSPFIETATILACEILEGKVSEGMLRQITKYLSAHFAFLKEGEIKSEKIGDSSTTFNRESGKGLCSTTYGQQAVALDPTGLLKSLNDKKPGDGFSETKSTGFIEFC